MGLFDRFWEARTEDKSSVTADPPAAETPKAQTPAQPPVPPIPPHAPNLKTGAEEAGKASGEAEQPSVPPIPGHAPDLETGSQGVGDEAANKAPADPPQGQGQVPAEEAPAQPEQPPAEDPPVQQEASKGPTLEQAQAATVYAVVMAPRPGVPLHPTLSKLLEEQGGYLLPEEVAAVTGQPVTDIEVGGLFMQVIRTDQNGTIAVPADKVLERVIIQDYLYSIREALKREPAAPAAEAQEPPAAQNEGGTNAPPADPPQDQEPAAPPQAQEGQNQPPAAPPAPPVPANPAPAPEYLDPWEV